MNNITLFFLLESRLANKESLVRIAIMQPYFMPYAGYFRLFAAADLFVIYDCVQFVRRGYLHRNQLTNHQGNLDWLTLPLAKAAQDVKISALTFAADADSRMKTQLQSFPVFNTSAFAESAFQETLFNFSISPLDYIVKNLKLTCDSLQLPFNVTYSSQLCLPAELKGEERIIAIAKHFKAETYLNSPGGRDLYGAKRFAEQQLKLQFLTPYQGSKESILSRLLTENTATIREEIHSQLESVT